VDREPVKVRGRPTTERGRRARGHDAQVIPGAFEAAYLEAVAAEDRGYLVLACEALPA